MLQKFKQFNDISEELANSVPKLKGSKTFHMLTGVANNHPLAEENAKVPVYYPLQQIPSRCKIWDAWKNNGKGAYVEVALGGVINTSQGREVLDFKRILPGEGKGYWGISGKFTVNEGIHEDEELWEYLHLSTFLKKEGVTATGEELVELLDFDRETLEAAKEISGLTDALIYLRAMGVEEARQVAGALNWKHDEDDDIVRAKVIRFGRENPDVLMKMVGDPNTKLKATLKEAFDKGILKYHTNSGGIEFNGSNIVTFNGSAKGFDYLSKFADWIKSTKNGSDVLENIQKQVAGETKEKKKEKVAEPA